MQKKIVEKELSYLIVGFFFKIQKNRGRFCTERQYCDEFENELKLIAIPYSREKDMKTVNPKTLVGNR